MINIYKCNPCPGLLQIVTPCLLFVTKMPNYSGYTNKYTFIHVIGIQIPVHYFDYKINYIIDIWYKNLMESRQNKQFIFINVKF